ncbi:MAG: hypothetical protein P4M13_09560 [Alphaproteobacteria bacterium]|nr:hypothetical protein [Alphaproteobacteria bacterium]
MRKHYSIDQLSTATSRQAQSESARMQSEIRKLRDSISGMAIKNPKIRASRARTKKTTTTSIWADIADIGAYEFIGGSASAAQSASNSLAILAFGQRIR